MCYDYWAAQVLRQLFTSPISLLEITEEHVKWNPKYLTQRWGKVLVEMEKERRNTNC